MVWAVSGWSGTHLTTKALSLSICRRETSRRAVEGTPSSSISNLVFFSATSRPFARSRALYTFPYVPCPIFSSFSYASLIECPPIASASRADVRPRSMPRSFARSCVARSRDLFRARGRVRARISRQLARAFFPPFKCSKFMSVCALCMLFGHTEYRIQMRSSGMCVHADARSRSRARRRAARRIAARADAARPPRDARWGRRTRCRAISSTAR